MKTKKVYTVHTHLEEKNGREVTKFASYTVVATDAPAAAEKATKLFDKGEFAAGVELVAILDEA